jgi:hypothetical protein
VIVASLLTVGSTDPHDEQKFASGGLRWPQLVQNTSSTLPRHPFRLSRVSLLVEKSAIRIGIEQSAERVFVRRIDLTDPAVSVGVIVELLRCL